MSIAYALIWFLYMQFVMPYAFITIGKCDGTPGSDFSRAIYLVPLYFVILCSFFLYLIRSLRKIVLKICLTVIFVIILPLFYSIDAALFFNLDVVISIAQYVKVDAYLFNQACYMGLEPKISTILVPSSLLLAITLYYFLKYKVHNKR